MSGNGDDCVLGYGPDGRLDGTMIHWNCEWFADGTVTNVGAATDDDD